MKVTLDPNNCGSSIKLNKDNLIASMSKDLSNTLNFVRATHGVSSGKWYWEAKIINTPKSESCYIGIVSKDESNFSTAGSPYKGSYPSFSHNAYCYTGNNTRNYFRWYSLTNYSSELSPMWKTDDVMGFALDMDNKTLSLYINGVLISGSTITGLTNDVYHPYIGIGSYWMDGQDFFSKFNFGEFGFQYPVPDGYRSYYEVGYDPCIVNMDSTVKWNGFALSENNLLITTNGVSGGGHVRASHSVRTGKWYWEVEVLEKTAGLTVGIISECNADPNQVAVFADKWNSEWDLTVGSGVSYVPFTWLSERAYVIATKDINDIPVSSVHPAWVANVGDTIGVALDMDSKVIHFYKNNVLIESVSNLPDKPFYPGVSGQHDAGNYPGTAKVRVNFGNSANGFKYYILGYSPYYTSIHKNKVHLDPDYCGSNLILSYNKLQISTVTTPTSNFTRCKYGTYCGKWYFEGQLVKGSKTAIGVVSKEATDVNVSGWFNDYSRYSAKLLTKSGICWYTNTTTLQAGIICATTNILPERIMTADNKFIIGDIIGIVLNMNNNSISFYKNGIFKETINNIPKNKLFYPAISLIINQGDSDESAIAEMNYGEVEPFKYPIPQEDTKPYYYLIYDGLFEDFHIY